MAYKVNNNITIENAKLMFRNFSGKEGQYNPPGKRNFCVLLDEDIAQNLVSDGWNVRYLQPKDPMDHEQAYLQVAVSFDPYPPKVVLISSAGKTKIEEDEVNILDWAEISNVDLIIRPYNWERNGKGGVKAYLKAMYVTIVEDELEAKYRNVPDSAQNSFPEEFYGD